MKPETRIILETLRDELQVVLSGFAPSDQEIPAALERIANFAKQAHGLETGESHAKKASTSSVSSASDVEVPHRKAAEELHGKKGEDSSKTGKRSHH